MTPDAVPPYAWIVFVVVGQIITFATLIWKDRQAAADRREQRANDVQDRQEQRENDLADRASLAAKVAADAEALRQHVAAEAEITRANTVAHADELRTAIQQNTAVTEEAKQVAKEAFVEANHVNNKISNLQEQLLSATSQRRTSDGADSRAVIAAAHETTIAVQETTAAVKENTVAVKQQGRP